MDLGACGGADRNVGRLLEVGALKHDNYASCSSWIECQPIDLRSRHPAIKEQDFLRMLDGPEDEASHRESWDAISLSLVVNFVPDAGDRGEWSLGRPNVNCEHNSHVNIQGGCSPLRARC